MRPLKPAGKPMRTLRILAYGGWLTEHDVWERAWRPGEGAVFHDALRTLVQRGYAQVQVRERAPNKYGITPAGRKALS